MKPHRSAAIALLSIFIFCPPLLSEKISTLARFPEPGLLLLKEAGRYGAVLDLIRDWGVSLEDPVAAEINLFRIQELIAYPELYEKCQEAISAVLKSHAAMKYPFLRDRADNLKNILYLKKGDVLTSEGILNSLSYLGFSISRIPARWKEAESAKPHGAAICFDEGARSGKSGCPNTWFEAHPDRTGKIPLNDLFKKTKDAVFFLNRKLSIEHDGEYFLILGKTGKTDLWLDGTLVFSNSNTHGFGLDQYFILVNLSEGTHRIFIRLFDSNHGGKISLRLVEKNGTRVAVVMPGKDAGKKSSMKLRGISFSPALAGLRQRKSLSSEERFAVGYLYYMNGLGCDPAAAEHLSSVPAGDVWYSSASYYMALSEHDPGRKDDLLRQSSAANPKNIEALRELAAHRIRNGFMYEAFPVISAIGGFDPTSPWYLESMARFFIKKQWSVEALRYAGLLKNSDYPSLGYRYEARIFIMEGDQARAVPNLEFLVDHDKWAKLNYSRLISAYENSGRYSFAIQALHRASAMFPSCVRFRLRLAGLIEQQENVPAALPYLSAALKISPCHAHALRSIGDAFYNMGRPDLAAYYLEASLNEDPDNHILKQRLAIIRRESRRPR